MYILPPSQRQLQVEGQDSWQIPLHKGICRIFAIIIRSKFENETGDILGSWHNLEICSYENAYINGQPRSKVEAAASFKAPQF
jgi:hypothetical protein